MNWKGHILLYCATFLAGTSAVSAVESQPQQIESRLETQTASVIAGSDGIALTVADEKPENFTSILLPVNSSRRLKWVRAAAKELSCRADAILSNAAVGPRK